MICKHYLSTAGLVGSIAILASRADAQWSHNPTVNLGISTAASDQSQPKVAPTPDGGCYVVWLDGIGTGWDTRLQRLNARGIPQWPGNGVLVADTAFSSTEDYGITVDAAGNAIVAYRDNSTGTTHAEAQKVDPRGNLLWNPAGVQVSTATSNAPKVCMLSDGNIGVMWTQSPGVRFQKLDPNGNILLAAGGIIENPVSSFYLGADLQPGDNGSAIMSWVKFTQRHLWSQKIDSAGIKVWNAGSPRIVFDGSALANGYQPAFLADGSGGAIYCWYDLGAINPLNVRVQRVDAAGTEVFPHNGVVVSTNTADRYRSNPSASYNAASDEIYVFWGDTALPTTLGTFGVSGQKIDGTSGARMWGDSAINYVPFSTMQNSFVRTVALPGGGAIVSFIDRAGGSAQIKTLRVDNAGATVWSPAIVDACALGSGKSRLFASAATGSRVLLTWGDARTDANDIYAQCVNLNGSLGNPGDVNDDGVVNVDDLLGVINAWGLCPAPPAFCPADVAVPPIGDGVINVDDLLAVINNWG
jgi:hypothetical protein